MSDRINKPVHEARIGSIKAAIWANATDSGGTRYAVTIARIYRKEGQWQQTSSFGVDDLPVLQKVVDQAFEAILALQNPTPPEPPASSGNTGNGDDRDGDGGDKPATSDTDSDSGGDQAGDASGGNSGSASGSTSKGSRAGKARKRASSRN